VGALMARTALVTGAAGGLGRSIATRLAGDGINLVLTGRGTSALSELADSLRTRWPERDVRCEACDLEREQDIAQLMERLAQQGLSPEIVVNNAAVQGPIGPFASNDWAAWAATVGVDLLAPVRLAQLALPAMSERGWGRIINISGGGATGPRPDFSAYAVAKTGLVRFTETLAHELKGSGVTVNAVAPGPMNTKMLDEVLQAGPERAAREYAGAVARAREGGVPPTAAAALIAWLASDASEPITGRLLSAVWDPWEQLTAHAAALDGSDIYTLRRIVPRDRGHEWGDR
jgi:3-oxoacyl-[acyl-carrier protein] reductase